jgi:hypothetical protein
MWCLPLLRSRIRLSDYLASFGEGCSVLRLKLCRLSIWPLPFYCYVLVTRTWHWTIGLSYFSKNFVFDNRLTNSITQAVWNSLKFIKLKLSHYTPRSRLGERRYSSYSFSTSALDGGEWSASRPVCALAPGKGPPVPTAQEAGWASEPVWTQRLEEKSFRLWRGLNLDRPVVQPVARHYTDWATRLTISFRYIVILSRNVPISPN